MEGGAATPKSPYDESLMFGERKQVAPVVSQDSIMPYLMSVHHEFSLAVFTWLYRRKEM